MTPITLTKPALQDALLKRIVDLAKAQGMSVNGLPLCLPIMERPEVRDPAQCNWALEDVDGLTPQGERIFAQAVAELSVDHRLPPHVYGLCASNC